MGGSFNPIHIAHLILGETACTDFSLDEVLFMPSGVSYMKDTSVMAQKEHRLKMCELACRDNPHFSVSRMEIDREGDTYTVDTLTALHEAEPETEWFFILGADSLFTIERWHRVKEIFALATILAAVRNGMETDALREKAEELHERFGARVQFLSSPQMEISSTDIRRRIRNGQSVKYFVPDACIDYMKEQRLFQ